ncbi:MAG TPA: hypothetical protein VGD22_11650 [Sphingobacteriaceae bacterium]
MTDQENQSGDTENQQNQDNKVKLVDAKYSDAASSDQRDTERMLEADKAAAPSYELHTENEVRLKENEEPENKVSSEDQEQVKLEKLPVADPDETAKLGEELGGTTNLSLDQLKEEGGSAGEEDFIQPS